jgi:hypothetical protein
MPFAQKINAIALPNLTKREVAIIMAATHPLAAAQAIFLFTTILPFHLIYGSFRDKKQLSKMIIAFQRI